MTTSLQQPQAPAPLRALIDSDYGKATIGVCTAVCESPALVSAVQTVLAAGTIAKSQLPGSIEKSLDEKLFVAYSLVDSEENINKTIDTIDSTITGKISEAKSNIVRVKSQTQLTIDATVQTTKTGVSKSLVALDHNKHVNTFVKVLEPALEAVVDYILPAEHEEEEDERGVKKLKKEEYDELNKLMKQDKGDADKSILEIVQDADANGSFALKKTLRLSDKVIQRFKNKFTSNSNKVRAFGNETKQAFTWGVVTLQILLHQITEFGLKGEGKQLQQLKGKVYDTVSTTYHRIGDFSEVQLDAYGPVVAPMVAPVVTPVAPFVLGVISKLAGVFGAEEIVGDLQQHPMWLKMIKYAEDKEDRKSVV